MVDSVTGDNNTTIQLTLEPLQSVIYVYDNEIIFNEIDKLKFKSPLSTVEKSGFEKSFSGKWKRSMVKSIDYPRFEDEKKITILDNFL